MKSLWWHLRNGDHDKPTNSSPITKRNYPLL